MPIASGTGTASAVHEAFALRGWIFDLLKDDDIEEVLRVLQTANFRPDLIVLDTLARLIPGADENSAQYMGKAVAAIDRLRGQTSATVLLIHHTVKAGTSERGSGALRGAADVMIECSRGDFSGLVSLKCGKMKDAEPFPDATLGLEKITLGPSSSSLAVADWKEAFEANSGLANKAHEVLEQKFGSRGATNKEWLQAYVAETGQGKSTFDRAVRKLKSERRRSPRRQKLTPRPRHQKERSLYPSRLGLALCAMRLEGR
jgi:AAA domain